jgi:hypothetical protein
MAEGYIDEDGRIHWAEEHEMDDGSVLPTSVPDDQRDEEDEYEEDDDEEDEGDD